MHIGSRASFASLRPFGIGHPRERHLAAAAEAAWASRHALRFGLDVLRHGVCVDCSLGSHGWRDDAIDGVHLCARRLRNLDRWTAPAFDPGALPDLTTLRGLPADRLRALGRVPVPLILRARESRFVPASWSDAINLAATRVREAEGIGVLVDAATCSNEGMFLTERLARRLDTPHIDLMGGAGGRVVHSVLQWTAGLDAGTCSLRDLLDADLVLLWGTGVDRHPFLARLLHLAHRGGTRVIALGPEREREFDGVWLPSEAGSTVFGSRIVDDHLPVQEGTDRHLAWALMAELLWSAGIDLAWLEARADGWQTLLPVLREVPLEGLAHACGLPTIRIRHLAGQLASSRRTVVLTGPALGRGQDGNQTLGAVVALSLLLGLIGRKGSGLLPLGGEPGWQGGRDLGISPRAGAAHGWHAHQIAAAACDDELDLLHVAGSGLGELLPEHADPAEALRSTRVRVHQVLELDPAVLAEPGEVVIVLPVQSRYEQRGGSSATSVDRIVRFSPEIRGHAIEGCRPDWQVPALVAQRLFPEERAAFDPVDSAAVREQIADTVPGYEPIDLLHAPGDAFQWGGATLHESGFATPDGRARIPPIEPPPQA